MKPSPTPICFAAPWELADASALQALTRGEATPEQQRRAMDWIIKIGAGTYNATFVPGQPDATTFMEGRRFVGLRIIELLTVIPAAFTKETTHA